MHKIDYDLFVLDPENVNTREDQFRDCLYDALEILDRRVETLESALDTQERINRMFVDAIVGIARHTRR